MSHMWPDHRTTYILDEWDDDVAMPDDRLTDVLRSALHEDYADASDEQLDLALSNMLTSMSPAEAINFASALNQIGRSASSVASDPTVGAVARTALPIVGGAVGTYFGGPVGTALGSQLGTAAAQALPTRPPGRAVPPQGPAPGPMAAPAAPAPAAPGVAAPAATGPAPVGPMADPAVTAPAAPGVAATAPTSPPERPGAGLAATPTMPPGGIGRPAASGGSSAAAQAAVMSQHPHALLGLLAAALGQYGRRDVGGVPVAQLLAMLSQLYGQAAADADELMYLDHVVLDGEDVDDAPSYESDHVLYTALVDADNIELAEAVERDGNLT